MTLCNHFCMIFTCSLYPWYHHVPSQKGCLNPISHLEGRHVAGCPAPWLYIPINCLWDAWLKGSVVILTSKRKELWPLAYAWSSRAPKSHFIPRQIVRSTGGIASNKSFFFIVGQDLGHWFEAALDTIGFKPCTFVFWLRVDLLFAMSCAMYC